MCPDGIRVLSIYSGIGGAEVRLHRVGIPLKCVISVEESEVNRKILRRWWLKSEQTGVLRQRAGIWKLKTHVIENFERVWWF
jgi:site-specific DNA-cytosine methylase